MSDDNAMQFAVKAQGRCSNQQEAEKELSAFGALIGIPIVIGLGVAVVADDLLLDIPSTIVGGVIGGILDLF